MPVGDESISSSCNPSWPLKAPKLVNGRLQCVSRVTSLAFYNAIATRKRDPIGLNAHIWFPLPADHLLTLVQFNVYRAIMTNMKLLNPMTCQGSEPIPTAEPSALVNLSSSLSALAALPPSLLPTLIQKRVPHPSWIDTIPLAALRDNLILELGNYDEDALCLDTLGCMFHDYAPPDYERRGIVVWSDPCDISAWELSEGFLHKYAFLLNDCGELLDSTNYWRAVRGERGINMLASE